MKIEKKSVAGTLQSNDCMIHLSPCDEIQIKLDSPVAYEFGDQIEKVVRETAEKEGIDGSLIEIEDKGALDCTIQARLRTAIRRAK